VPTQDVLLRLPNPLYERIKQRADQARHSVEDELIDVLATAVPVVDELPAGLAEAVASLATLDDGDLWDAARSHMPVDDAERLEELNFKRQRDGLTVTEVAEAATLLARYDRTMLVRARAAAVLKERGHDISALMTAA
jgi:plasmid stability protein